MKHMICLTILLACLGIAQAGNNPDNHRDYELQPGDFAKPIIINPLMPGIGNDHEIIDDPDIIDVIGEDEPSDEDVGLIYLGSQWFLVSGKTNGLLIK